MYIDEILDGYMNGIRVNLIRLQLCQSGSSVGICILNERDPLITSRCQVRLWYRHYVDINRVCRGRAVLQTLARLGNPKALKMVIQDDKILVTGSD